MSGVIVTTLGLSEAGLAYGEIDCVGSDAGANAVLATI
jgi:hypothetical protein